MKPRVLLVDGYSIIFRWEELRALHKRRPAAARARLVELCTRHGDAQGIHVVIVFDGRGPKPALDPTETRVQIFYSKSGQTADEVIERLVAKYAPTHEITVATDDHLERTTVLAFGGKWISSESLLHEMEESARELERRIKELRRQS